MGDVQLDTVLEGDGAFLQVTCRTQSMSSQRRMAAWWMRKRCCWNRCARRQKNWKPPVHRLVVDFSPFRVHLLKKSRLNLERGCLFYGSGNVC